MEFYNVVEFAPDPPGWRAEIERWEQTYGETVVLLRDEATVEMGPATDEAEQAVQDETLTHDGNPRLALHVVNCVHG